jgi:hypothetical protein
MMRIRHLILTYALSLAGWSCTAVGYGLGAVVDSGEKARFAPSAAEPAPFAQGQRVRIVLKDGAVAEGQYRGTHTSTPSGESGSSQVHVVRLEERGRSGTRDVPVDHVARIESRPKSGRTTGLILGALIDVASIIAFIANPPAY